MSHQQQQQQTAVVNSIVHALSILGISVESIQTMTQTQLRHIYHSQALKTHPDKNDRVDAAEVFVQVKAAYKLLRVYLDPDVSASDAEAVENATDDATESEHEVSFATMADNFVQSIFSGTDSDSKLSHMIRSIAQMCITKTPALMHTLVERKLQSASQQVCIDMYAFLTKYQSILGLRQDTLDMIQSAIHARHQTTDIITLRPSINDLLQHRVYSELQMPGGTEMLAVPLWCTNAHLYFNGCTPKHIVVVMIMPNLPTHTHLDENNTLYCDLWVSPEEILSRFESPAAPLQLTLGRYQFNIFVENLFWREDQIYILHGQGISAPNDADPFNIGPRGDIHVRVRINQKRI